MQVILKKARFRKRKAKKREPLKVLFGGATQIRTGESRICSPLPYHLAMAPSSLINFVYQTKSLVLFGEEESPIRLDDSYLGHKVTNYQIIMTPKFS